MSDYKKELSKWIEQNRQGFYLGCRMDEHSPQINEFAEGLNYYLKREGIPYFESLESENARLHARLEKAEEVLKILADDDSYRGERSMNALGVHPADVARAYFAAKKEGVE